MTILGAQLDDLSRLSQRLTTTAGDVAGSRDGAIRTTAQVVTGVQEAAQAALEQIMTHMDQLGQSVAASVAEAASTASGPARSARDARAAIISASDDPWAPGRRKTLPKPCFSYQRLNK